MLQVKASYTAGMEFAHAKAWLEAANRGSIHLSLLIMFGLGGWLILQGHMPLRVMLTGIGFTYSLMYATQVRAGPTVAPCGHSSDTHGRVAALPFRCGCGVSAERGEARRSMHGLEDFRGCEAWRRV